MINSQPAQGDSSSPKKEATSSPVATPAANGKPALDLADSIFGLELSVGRPTDPTEEIEAFLGRFSSSPSAVQSLDEKGLIETFRIGALLHRSIAISDAVQSVRKSLGDNVDDITRAAENADGNLNEFYRQASPFELYRILGSGQHALGIFTRAVLHSVHREASLHDLINETPRGITAFNRAVGAVSQELARISEARIADRAGTFPAGVHAFLKERTPDLWDAAGAWLKSEVKTVALLGESPSIATCAFEPSISAFRVELLSEEDELAPPVSDTLRARLGEVLVQVTEQVKAMGVSKWLPLDLQERLREFF